MPTCRRSTPLALALALGWVPLSAQGVQLAGGYVLAAAPDGPGVDSSTLAAGWTGGLGLDVQLLDRLRLMGDGRFLRTSVPAGITRAESGGLDLEYRRNDESIGVRLGVAGRRETSFLTGSLRTTSTWARVSFLLPGLLLPLPAAGSFGLHPFGNFNLSTFTRLEYAHALHGERLGNPWEGSWSIGIRFDTSG